MRQTAICVSGAFDRHFQPDALGGHIKFWSKKSLTAALERAGFCRVEFRGRGKIPVLWKYMVLAGERPAGDQVAALDRVSSSP